MAGLPYAVAGPSGSATSASSLSISSQNTITGLESHQPEPPLPIFSISATVSFPSNPSTHTTPITFQSTSTIDLPDASSSSPAAQSAYAPNVTKLRRSPYSQQKKAAPRFHSSRRRRESATVLLQVDEVTLLENTLKLASLGVSAQRPDPRIAPKVTLSDQCRPDAKVIFDQSRFGRCAREQRLARGKRALAAKGNATTQDEGAGSIHSSLTSFPESDLPSRSSTNTLTSTTSIGSPPTALSAVTTSFTPDMDSQSVTSATSSGQAAKTPAWSTPRSWAEMAAIRSRSANGVVITSNHAFSHHVSDYASNGSPSSQLDGLSISRIAGLNGRTKFGAPLSLEEAVRQAESCFTAPLTYPRGMINRGNMCFTNAILQVLVYCSPFYNLFQLVGDYLAHDFRNSSPLMEATISFLAEFQQISPSLQKALQETPSLSVDLLRDVQASSEPFVPEYLYEAMKLNKRFDAMRRGHQEDAEEFLGFFLDTLHEELLTAIRLSNEKLAAIKARSGKGDDVQQNGPSESTSKDSLSPDSALMTEREVKRPVSPMEGNGWLEVGQKGKTSFTRTTSTAHSPITRIFGGKLRSLLRMPGSKDSVTLEPYQALQLDIQPSHVTTIEEALQNLTVAETISGVQSSTARGIVEATKQVFIETLPPILILHLKRFVYDDVGGVQKSSKVLGYGPTLEVAENIISQARRSEAQRKYKLFGVVYHHGRYASGGHYTVDVLKQDRTEWLHIDDTTWSTATTPSVRASNEGPKKQHHDGVAYLLFYVREDAVLASGRGVDPDKKQAVSPSTSASVSASASVATNDALRNHRPGTLASSLQKSQRVGGSKR